jgi:hypothetical protein
VTTPEPEENQLIPCISNTCGPFEMVNLVLDAEFHDASFFD